MTTIKIRYKTSDGEIRAGETYEFSDEDDTLAKIGEVRLSALKAAEQDDLTVEAALVDGKYLVWVPVEVPRPVGEGGFWSDRRWLWLDSEGMLDWPWIIFTLLSLIALLIVVLSV